jgi:hypothetical protein
MRRERLVWFAAGAAVSGFVSILVQLIVDEPPQLIPMLAVEERIEESLELGEDEWRQTVPLNARLMHGCGARAFEVDSIFPDGGGQARVPIASENRAVIDCILKEGIEQDFEMSVLFSPSLKVQQP